MDGSTALTTQCPRCKGNGTSAYKTEWIIIQILMKKYRCEKVYAVCSNCQLLFDYVRHGGEVRE